MTVLHGVLDRLYKLLYSIFKAQHVICTTIYNII